MGQEILSFTRHVEAGHTQLQEVKVVFPLLLLWQPPMISDQSPLFGKSAPDLEETTLLSVYPGVVL